MTLVLRSVFRSISASRLRFPAPFVVGRILKGTILSGAQSTVLRHGRPRGDDVSFSLRGLAGLATQIARPARTMV
jgi:hypothetical protein